ncbi:SPFH domain-containing protein [Labrys neptuniae]
MASIRRYPFMSHARVEASSFLAVYRRGRLTRSGRGQAVWFSPQGSTSLVEVPADDRNHIVAVSGRTADFQAVSVQGLASWRAQEPVLLAERIDFSIDPRSGAYRADPVTQVENLIDGLVKTAVERFLSARGIAAVLSEGVGTLLAEVERDLAATGALTAIGVALTGIHLSDLTPSPELVRALRQPTAEKLQQAADEATFARRAAAVEKEAAIAENETKAKIRLEEERGRLFERERENELAQARTAADKNMVAAEGEAAARELTARSQAVTHGVASEAEAEAIRRLDEAKLAGERVRAEIANSLPVLIPVAEALKEAFANAKVGTLNLGPDVLAQLGTVLGGALAKGGKQAV